MNRKLIEYVFENSEYVNTKYMPNMILISDVYIENRQYDVVIYKNGEMGIYENFSEYINGKIAGGWLYQEKDVEGFSLGLVIFNGDVYVPPDWDIVAWDQGDDKNHMKIKDGQGNWFTIGKKTNWKPVLDNE